MVRAITDHANSGESHFLVVINTDDRENSQFCASGFHKMSMCRAVVILLLFVVAVNCDKYFGIKKKKKPHHHDMLCKVGYSLFSY